MAKVHITVPVSPEQREILLQLAAESGMSLSAFCRHRMIGQGSLANDVFAIQDMIMAAVNASTQTQTTSKNGTESETHSMLAEALLLLRSLIPPQKVMTIHGELKRRGLTPFSE